MNQKGKIFLVGLGPGDTNQMTGRARQAIEQSEVVIGYKTYIRLIKELLDGKEVVQKGMAEELDRCTDALKYVNEGRNVSLISSGDVGVFGMAGPMYEVLLESGWKQGDIEVEVVPGVSALSSCAALAGAPLTHDFCAISLSDLLTPWPVIARRLDGAARADFVTALYNPKSSRRPKQIEYARDLFLRHRSPETPVALVRAAYRTREQLVLTTLSDMTNHEITMLTTVIIGNSSSFIREGRMVTPRGYRNKYEQGNNQVRHGEQAGRSLSEGLHGWSDQLIQRLHDGEDINDLADAFQIPLLHLFDLLFDQAPEALQLERTNTPTAADFEQLGQICQARLSIPAAGSHWFHTQTNPQPRVDNEQLIWAIGESEFSLPLAEIEQIVRIKSATHNKYYLLSHRGELLLKLEVNTA